MVILIGNTCRSNGAQVWDDPATLDLLIEFKDYEFLVEVKSVTSRNFIKRIRYALGQLLHYDYLRSSQGILPRRKVIALAAQVSNTSWCIDFLNSHVDTDFLTLRENTLHLDSPFSLSHQLFTPSQSSLTQSLFSTP